MTVNERRIADAMSGPQTPAGETEAELLAEIESLGESIAASQSTDDMGPEMNAAIYAAEKSTWARLDAAKAKFAKLRAAQTGSNDRG